MAGFGVRLFRSGLLNDLAIDLRCVYVCECVFSWCLLFIFCVGQCGLGTCVPLDLFCL